MKKFLLGTALLVFSFSTAFAYSAGDKKVVGLLCKQQSDWEQLVKAADKSDEAFKEMVMAFVNGHECYYSQEGFTIELVAKVADIPAVKTVPEPGEIWSVKPVDGDGSVLAYTAFKKEGKEVMLQEQDMTIELPE